MWRLRRTVRHTFGTRAVKEIPIKLLADLMGTSVAMVERVYGHTADDYAFMRKTFNMVAGVSLELAR
jgi:hypothetical protein